MLKRQCAIAVFALAFGLTGFALSSAARDETRAFVAANPPKPLAPFQFENASGQSLDLKDFRGRYVLLNLWATWCEPCAQEMPALNALRKKLDHAKFEVIALAEDRDGPLAVQSFFKRHRIDNLAIFTDPSGQAPFALHARGLPTTLLISPEGLEIARMEGEADWTEKNLVAFLEAQGAH